MLENFNYQELNEGVDADAISSLANNFDYGAMIGGIVAGFLSDQTSGICFLFFITLNLTLF